MTIADMIANAFWWAFGDAYLYGLVLFGVVIYFLIVNRVDRGGLTLVGLLTLGYMSTSKIVGAPAPLLPVWIFYTVLAAVAVFAALGFINIQREA